MATIEEAYVSFETAKLLKEKGFNEKCQKVYLHNGETQLAQNFMEGEYFVNNEDIDSVSYYKDWITYTQGNYAYLCPTQQMAMTWLREVHKIYIDISPTYCEVEKTIHFIWQILDSNYDVVGDCEIFYGKYETACEEAIKYCLENII